MVLLMSFSFTGTFGPSSTKEECAELRRTTREQIEKEAAVWAKLIIDIGMGKLKKGWEFPPADGA